VTESQGSSICVVGLGYVGLPLAVEFARKHRVIGLDSDTDRVEQLRQAIDRTREVEQADLSTVEIEYTSDPGRIGACEFVILCVPTPIDSNNTPDLSLIEQASALVGQNLRRGSVVILESTVYPGVTEEICVPILERESDMSCPADFGVGYSPERVNPGDKEHTITTIVKVVSGCDDETLERVAALYESIVEAGVHRAPNIRTAEAAKVIENVQRDLNIALFNELAMIFERMGLRTQDVAAAAATKWNFHKYSPGLVGGHCIGVDPYYLTHKAQQLGYHPEIILAGRRLNDNMHRYVVGRLVKALNQTGIPSLNATVLVLGLTFKENCSDDRNSRAKHLVQELRSFGCRVLACDPWLSKERIRDIHQVEPVTIESLGARLTGGAIQAVVVTVPHREFAALPLEAAPVVLDIKGAVSPRYDSL